MKDRSELVESIAHTIRDYREGEIDQRGPDHVDRWIRQFDADVQDALLQELDLILSEWYISKNEFSRFLRSLIKNIELAGPNPVDFWRNAHFLRIQEHGHSQVELLSIFDEMLQAQYGLQTATCGAEGGSFIYLDDIIFSGNRVLSDLSQWIATDAPAQASVHVIVAVIHTYGEYYIQERLMNAVASSGKNIDIHYWRAVNVENRKYYKKDSELLWPAELPDDEALKAYLAIPQRFPFEPRPTGGKLGPFSSEESRQLLEREFTLAGIRIRGFCENPKSILRPLGFSRFGLGFGSMIVTFRNCPNNCPLALWWGDPSARPSHPFSKWTPLFPRKTYGDLAQGTPIVSSIPGIPKNQSKESIIRWLFQAPFTDCHDGCCMVPCGVEALTQKGERIELWSWLTRNVFPGDRIWAIGRGEPSGEIVGEYEVYVPEGDDIGLAIVKRVDADDS